MVDDSSLYERFQGLMKKELITMIVPSEFICRLPCHNECISYPGPIETLKVKFCLPLYPFIECSLARYGLVPMQLHLNTWKGIINFMVKCAEVGFKPKMRALRSVLFLKVSLVSSSMVYTSYKSSGLAPLVSESVHRWSDSFFFIRLASRSWAFGHVWRFRLRMDLFRWPTYLSIVDWDLVQ